MMEFVLLNSTEFFFLAMSAFIILICVSHWYDTCTCDFEDPFLLIKKARAYRVFALLALFIAITIVFLSLKSISIENVEDMLNRKVIDEKLYSELIVSDSKTTHFKIGKEIRKNNMQKEK